ncbi:hypothetical protein M9H77_24823 [Catharanthus roseus]|uniref:Uncharacterized protein n=1 Tax=Catharanthus roseus TaxID=4058 RepID=A0ACC0A700_CATRO|nr:hypothetical protein M9H77_24823 [Catharanthus roseus]
MRVAIEILTGRLFYIDVEDDATVADLKKKIGEQEKLPLDRLILVLHGHGNSLMIENELSLLDYGVCNGSLVYLFIEPADNGSSHFLFASQDSTFCHASPLIGQQGG